MQLLVAYYNFNNGGGHGRDRLREHVPNERNKPLCGAGMSDSDEYEPNPKLLWKIIDSQPKRLCSRCAELTKQPTDAERLKSWNTWAQSPEQ